MIEIDSIIKARVNRVEPYGVYLKYGEETVIVLAPEVSWLDKRDLHEQFKIGEELDVLVIRFNYKTREIVGSMRRLHPESNPFRKLSRLEPGTILRGRVSGVFSDGLTVTFPNGTWGNLPKILFPHQDFKAGNEVEVTIASLNVDEGILDLDFAGPVNGTSNSALAESHGKEK